MEFQSILNLTRFSANNVAYETEPSLEEYKELFRIEYEESCIDMGVPTNEPEELRTVLDRKAHDEWISLFVD